MLDVITKYFVNIFLASQVGDALRIYANVQWKVSQETNDELLMSFKSDKVWYAIKATAPSKT